MKKKKNVKKEKDKRIKSLSKQIYSPFRGLRVSYMIDKYPNSNKVKKLEISIVLYDDDDYGMPYQKDRIVIKTLVDPNDEERGRADRMALFLDALCRFINTGGLPFEITNMLRKVLNFADKNNFRKALPGHCILTSSSRSDEFDSYVHELKNYENDAEKYIWIENISFEPIDFLLIGEKEEDDDEHLSQLLAYHYLQDTDLEQDVYPILPLPATPNVVNDYHSSSYLCLPAPVTNSPLLPNDPSEEYNNINESFTYNVNEGSADPNKQQQNEEEEKKSSAMRNLASLLQILKSIGAVKDPDKNK
jgi:hypothetical protein